MITSRGFRASVVAFALTAALTVSSATGGQAVSVVIGDAGSSVDWLRLGMSMASPMRPFIDAIDGNQALNKGSDGRLTFLLMGLDARGAAITRTDTMMLMSIKGNTITSASIPRDTGRVPRPASMGGGYSGQQVALGVGLRPRVGRGAQ